MYILDCFFLLEFILILNHYLISYPKKSLLNHLLLYLFLEYEISSFLGKSIHVFYFLINITNKHCEFQVKFFKHESKDHVIKPNEEVHVDTETPNYHVLDLRV